MTKYKLYVEMQRHCGIKKGDTVKILRKAYEGEMGWNNNWDDEMDNCVGKTGIVRYIDNEGVTISIGGELWGFPFYVLEVIKENCILKPFDRVLVRDSRDESWCANLFSHYDSGLTYPYVCASSTWKYCISFEGNEHLVGTLDQE